MKKHSPSTRLFIISTTVICLLFLFGVPLAAETVKYPLYYPEGQNGISKYPLFWLQVPRGKEVTVEIVAEPKVECTMSVGEEGKRVLATKYNATVMHFSTSGLDKELNTLMLTIQPRATDSFTKFIEKGGKWKGEVVVRW